MNFSPNNLVANRTARLVAESKTPVHTTSTPAPAKREHVMAVELDSVYGRHWTPVLESYVDSFIAEMTQLDYDLSDVDHSARCWCS